MVSIERSVVAQEQVELMVLEYLSRFALISIGRCEAPKLWG